MLQGGLRAHEGGTKLVRTDSARQMEPASARVPRERSGGLAPFLKNSGQPSGLARDSCRGCPAGDGGAHMPTLGPHARKRGRSSRGRAAHATHPPHLSPQRDGTPHSFPAPPSDDFCFCAKFPPFPHLKKGGESRTPPAARLPRCAMGQPLGRPTRGGATHYGAGGKARRPCGRCVRDGAMHGA